jgi:hypothetical protein
MMARQGRVTPGPPNVIGSRHAIVDHSDRAGPLPDDGEAGVTVEQEMSPSLAAMRGRFPPLGRRRHAGWGHAAASRAGV